MTHYKNKSNSSIILLSNELEVNVGTGVVSLDPRHLKSCVKRALKQLASKRPQKHPISISSYLDELAGALGFNPDFDAYCQTIYPAIEEFLANQDATKPADLITPRRSNHAGRKGLYSGKISLNRQDVSERLFFSGLDLPARLFTGYNFDFWKYWDDGFYLFGELTEYLRKVPLSTPLLSWNNPDAISSNAALAMDRGQELMETGRYERGKDKKPIRRMVIDVLLAGSIRHFHEYFDLCGDMRFEYSNGKVSDRLTLNRIDTELDDTFQRVDQPIIDLFRYRFADARFGRYGWVDIVKYNDSLILLKGKRGEYEWLIRNQRDSTFDTHVYGHKLHARDMPKSSVDYKFEHWLHFKHTGWKAMDRIHAERARTMHPIPNDGGVFIGTEPQLELLMQYYARTGEFDNSLPRSSTIYPNYDSVDVGTGRIAVSPLVTIGQLIQWQGTQNCKTLPEGDDRLCSVNSDKDLELPAAVTWAVIQHYLKSEEARLGVPCRLVTEAEYRTMREGANINLSPRSDEPLLQFVTQENVVLEDHPPYMPEQDFQELFFRYRRKPDWVEHNNGIRAVDSNEIVEWLHGGTGIASRDLVCPDTCLPGFPLTQLALSSTGKYKGCKNVFRVCYELTHDS